MIVPRNKTENYTCALQNNTAKVLSSDYRDQYAMPSVTISSLKYNCSTSHEPPDEGGDGTNGPDTPTTVIIASVVSSIAAIVVVVIIVLYYKWRQRRNVPSPGAAVGSKGPLAPESVPKKEEGEKEQP